MFVCQLRPPAERRVSSPALGLIHEMATNATAGSSGTWPRERPRAYSASVVTGGTSTARGLADGEENIPRRKVRFQCGLFREEETFIGQDVKILCKETLLEYVCDLLTIRVSGINGAGSGVYRARDNCMCVSLYMPSSRLELVSVGMCMCV